MPGPVHRTFVPALLLGFLLVLPAHGSAQEENTLAAPVLQTVPDSVPAPTVVSPKGAFLRAVLLPGWGHASVGSYTRGGFYFAAEITTGWGLLRTNRRLGEIRDRMSFRENVLRAELAADGKTPEEITTALEADEVLEDMNDLLVSREDQQEDWAALGIFLLFLAGADAFVSAHLGDFPTPITMDAVPLPGGRVELSVGLKLPN